MTDGMNNWGAASNHNKSIYSPFGFFTNDRLGTGRHDGRRRARRSSTPRRSHACTKAKEAGITVYTVGFSVSTDPIDAAGKKLLQELRDEPEIRLYRQQLGGDREGLRGDRQEHRWPADHAVIAPAGTRRPAALLSHRLSPTARSR